MAKNKTESDFREKLDNHFGEICSYVEYVALGEISAEKAAGDSFLNEFSEEEIKKNWDLVRHGIGVTASVFINLIIDQNGNIDIKEIDKMLVEIKKISEESSKK